jgi:LEA14-like dessication related protein
MKKLLVLFPAVILTSCLSLKPPQFVRTQNLSSSKSVTDYELTFDLLMHNPNNWSLRLADMESEVRIDSMLIGKANLVNTIRLTRNSDFTLPMHSTTNLNDISNIASLGLNLLFGNQSATATIRGNMTLKKFIFKRKYQFEYKEKVDGKLLKSLF